MIAVLVETLAPLLGLSLGFLAGRRSRSKVIAPTDTQLAPICGCTHNFALHDPSSRMCFATVSITVFRVDRYVDDAVQCPCRQYVGPIPVDQYTSMPIAWDASVVRPSTPQESPKRIADVPPKPIGPAKRRPRKGDPDYGPP